MPTGTKQYNAKALRTAYAMSGWTQADLAVVSHLSDSTVCRVLKKQSASPRAIKAVADALRVPLEQVWR